ncbi:MAG: hypothetical protein IJ466_07900 [Clostridia bacterium]|nr:hypothetical protein [Clostridia bacterium]
MENPGQMLYRARQARRRKPAPQAAYREEAAARPAPQFVPRHSSYSALMRSHDRVNTRHIQDNR